MKQRRGITIVETIVSMSISAVIVGVAVGAIHQLFLAESRSRDHVARLVSVGRLADQFRRDVHASVGLADQNEMADNLSCEELHLATHEGQTIVYRVDATSVERIGLLGEDIQQLETYTLPPATEAVFEINDEMRNRMLTLRILPIADQIDGAKRPTHHLRVEATLAHDHRFALLTRADAPGAEGEKNE